MNTNALLNSFFVFGLLIISLAAVPDTAEGALILDEMWTGAELFNDPTISFPTRPPTLNRSQLRFDAPGVSTNAKLIEIPLVPAHSLTNATPVVITVTFNMTRRSSDYDPSIFVNDGGVNYLGFGLGDNQNGSGHFFRFIDADRNNVMDSYTDLPLFSNAGFPNVGNSFNVMTTFTLDSASTNVFGSFLSGSGHANGVALDQTTALGLSFWGNDTT